MNDPVDSPSWWLVVAAQEFDLRGAVFRPDKAQRILAMLREEGSVAAAQVVEQRAPVTLRNLRRVHTAGYLARLRGYAETVPAYAVAELEIPLAVSNLRAAELACGATLRAAQLALAGGRGAIHLGGGFHHAFAGHGEGFCLLNDVAVAVRALLEGDDDNNGESGGRRLSRALIVDLDAHQGNGTARIFRDEPRVYTMSLHNADIYPHPKEVSDLDVGLEPGTSDAQYLAALEEALPRAFAESGIITTAAAGAALVVLLAGADPYHDDRLGGLALTRQGLRRRSATVLRAAAEHGLPVLVVLAGGYARDTQELLTLHADTVREAGAQWAPLEPDA